MSRIGLQQTIEQIVKYHDSTMQKIINDVKANEKQQTRSKGGILRSEKGELVEELARQIIIAAWIHNLDQAQNRLTINKTKIPIHVREAYINKLTPPVVREYWIKNKKEMIYGFGTDLHVFIDRTFRIPVECKAYTENAMIKRILVDAELLKEALSIENYYLFQLESQLGGDYSSLNEITYGSKSTHTLASHFDVNLHIITLLEGERKVEEATHEEGFLKKLPKQSVERAISVFSEGMKPFCK